MGKKNKKPLSIPPENPKLKLKGSSRAICIEDIHESRDVIMVGNICGSNISLNSLLDGVGQSIYATDIDEQLKQQLSELLVQLEVELQKMSLTEKEEAEAIADAVKVFVDAGTKSRPNMITVQIRAEGLKKAAENVAGVMPIVPRIAFNIVITVSQIAGTPLP